MMKKMIKKTVFVITSIFTLFILYASNANAFYLDPGVSGTVISGLWQLIVAILTTIGIIFVKKFWNPIKNYFVKNKDENTNK